jgi:hypothetical protein
MPEIILRSDFHRETSAAVGTEEAEEYTAKASKEMGRGVS